MTTLGQLASLIRSKNAGPYELTVDIMFADAASYERALRAPCLAPEPIAKLLGVSVENLAIHPYPPALAIKITVPRSVSVGDPSERDLFGGQLFGPIVNLEVD